MIGIGLSLFNRLAMLKLSSPGVMRSRIIIREGIAQDYDPSLFHLQRNLLQILAFPNIGEADYTLHYRRQQLGFWSCF